MLCPISNRRFVPTTDIVPWARLIGLGPREAPGLSAMSQSLRLRRLKALLHLLDDLVDAKALRALTWRIILKRSQELADHGLSRDDHVPLGEHPIVVCVRGNVGPLVGVCPQIEQLGQAQLRERFGPDLQGAGGALFFEYHLPVFVAQGNEIAIVVEVNKLLARPALLLVGKVGKLIVAVEMDL